MKTKELIVDAAVEQLGKVNGFVQTLLEGMECSMKTQMQLDLAVEEIFVNIASYAYGEGQGTVTVRGTVTEEPPGVELTFMDEGTPYNPLKREDPDMTIPMEERGSGGLGIFLVKKNVDDIRYEYREGKNILVLRKKLA